MSLPLNHTFCLSSIYEVSSNLSRNYGTISLASIPLYMGYIRYTSYDG